MFSAEELKTTRVTQSNEWKMEKTITKTEYTVEHLLTALHMQEEMKNAPYLAAAATVDELMEMGLSVSDAAIINSAAVVLYELGIEI